MIKTDLGDHHHQRLRNLPIASEPRKPTKQWRGAVTSCLGGETLVRIQGGSTPDCLWRGQGVWDQQPTASRGARGSALQRGAWGSALKTQKGPVTDCLRGIQGDQQPIASPGGGAGASRAPRVEETIACGRGPQNAKRKGITIERLHPGAQLAPFIVTSGLAAQLIQASSTSAQTL